MHGLHIREIAFSPHGSNRAETTDRVIDLGPEGGDGGGLVIAQGTPEQVAEVPESFTGQYLRRVLGAHPATGS